MAISSRSLAQRSDKPKCLRISISYSKFQKSTFTDASSKTKRPTGGQRNIDTYNTTDCCNRQTNQRSDPGHTKNTSLYMSKLKERNLSAKWQTIFITTNIYIY
jgi:hypothetical protein